MTEFGIVLWPEAVLNLIRIHNPSYIPLDAKIVQFKIDAKDAMIEIYFDTKEDLGHGAIPVSDNRHKLLVN